MANEATLIVEYSTPVNFICANGTGIEKGALLTMADPMTASAATADGYVAGIAKAEKIANDGITSVSVYRDGIFRLTSSAAITAGQTVAMTGTGNKVKPATAADVGSKTLGIALETTTGDDETLLVELKPGVQTNAFA